MCVFFGGITQGFSGFRHSPVPTKTHTDKAIIIIVGWSTDMIFCTE